MSRGGFARDSAHSPAKASVHASRGIQHTRIGSALSEGRTESGEGEGAGLSMLSDWLIRGEVVSRSKRDSEKVKRVFIGECPTYLA